MNATISLDNLEQILEILAVRANRNTPLELLNAVQTKQGNPVTKHVTSVRPLRLGSDDYDAAVAAFKAAVDAAV